MMNMMQLRDGLEGRRRPGLYWIRRLGESNVRMGQWLGSYWIVDGGNRLTDDDIAAVSTEELRCEVA
jgi:hypothetical protein